jgi:hypothetical protein
MSRLSLLLVASLVLSGCWFKKVVPERQIDNLSGGEIMIESCGYTVKSPDNASRPEKPQGLFGPDPTPKQLHLTIPSRDAARTIAVTWRTNDDQTEASTVQYGTGGALDQTAEGFTFFFQAGEITPRMHEAHLCGLQPDTEYSYRVGGRDASGAEAWSQVYTFRTAPDRATQPDAEVNILVIGDTRDGYNIWGRALAKVKEMAVPDLILFDGDAVTLGPIQEEWDAWFDQGQVLLPYVAIVYAHGNHDTNSVNFYAQFAQPLDEQNFGLDFGPAHVTVLNDTPLIKGDVYSVAPNFLDNDMGQNVTAPWKIGLHHKPLYSAAASAIPVDEKQQEAWLPIYDKHAIDFDFAGHDHQYERTKPLRNKQPQASATAGTHYITVGSAGAPLYEAGTQFWTEFSEKAYNFAFLRLRGKQANFDAYRDDGSRLDQLAITKP